jgi:hypothetical protein
MTMRKGLTIVTGCLTVAIAAGLSPARAGWGCQAKDGAGFNNYSWGSATEAAAQEYTLNLCAADDHKGCHIVECRSGVDTQEQATSTWSIGTRTTKCIGSAKC